MVTFRHSAFQMRRTLCYNMRMKHFKFKFVTRLINSITKSQGCKTLPPTQQPEFIKNVVCSLNIICLYELKRNQRKFGGHAIIYNQVRKSGNLTSWKNVILLRRENFASSTKYTHILHSSGATFTPLECIHTHCNRKHNL